jgi:curved DNA-binding protein CbpA
MAGQLKNHPLTELVREISAAELSGALRLAQERARTVVYFESGEIIYAASNLRAYRLSECVRRWDVLSEPQLAGAQGKTSDLEFGSALVAAGAVSRETLEALVARQVSEMLYHTLAWTDGEWEFDPRVRLAGDVRVTIKPEKLLFESARRLPVEFVAARFPDGSEKLSPETGVPDDLNLLPTEAFVMTRIDAPLSVNELLAISGLPEAETLHVTYTLALGGFLRREKWPPMLTAAETAKARAVKVAPGKPVSPVAAEVKSEPKSAPSARAADPVEEERDEQSEIDALFAKARVTTDYYQMLGVRRSADAAEIKRAYYALAKRFHPDRFRKGAEAAQLTRIESAFAQIAQAYDALKNNNSRAVYDSKLLKQDEAARTSRASAAPKPDRASFNQSAKDTSSAASTPVTRPNPADTPYHAEERFKQGLEALQQGNHAFAIAALGEAARLAPSEARYHAYFGLALSKDERLRHSAEAEFKAAIALAANNTSFRVMLAEFYIGVGLRRRAEGELVRALSADPKDKVARQLLDKLKG